MPSQREIRRRIGSVGNIKQITRAMQFVAASKLKRAQDATLASRPYSEKLDEVLADVAAVVDDEHHPLLAEERAGARLIVLFTTDRGLAGSLNTNTIRFAAREIASSTRLMQTEMETLVEERKPVVAPAFNVDDALF